MLGDADAQRRLLEDEGYLFFRGLLDEEATLAVRRDITTELDQLGWLAEGSDPMQALRGPRATGEGPAPTEAFFEAYTRVQRLQAFHELAHGTTIVDTVGAVIGADVLVHPRKIFRVSPAEGPQFVTPPHQDYRLIQGTTDVLTAWVPIGPCPDELGGLKVLAGSHRDGLLPARGVQATGGVTCDVAPDDPRWRSTDFEAGDVLLFHSLTVHGAKANRTPALRLSADFRYQDREQPVVDRSLLPHYWPEIPSYTELTRGWSSTSSVDAPDGLQVTTMADPMDDALAAPPSLLVGSP